jgi:hypothetical protein
VDLVPGARLELDDGPSLDVTGLPSLITPGLVALEVRADGEHAVALLGEPGAEESRRDEVARLLAQARSRALGRFGPAWRGMIRRSSRELGGYRDAAVRTDLSRDRCLVFRPEPTMLLTHVLTPHTRVPWPPRVVARLGLELARAMLDGTVRRLDPRTVGLAGDGAFVVDAALDALLRPSAPHLEGSPAWMSYLAPERIRAKSGAAVTDDAGARHALGVLLHELLFGAPLYGRDTPLETIIAIRHGLPTPLTPRVPELPLDVAACVHALLDQDPLRRPDPHRVASVLAPHAAVDLAWTTPLLERHARVFDVLPSHARPRS